MHHEISLSFWINLKLNQAMITLRYEWLRGVSIRHEVHISYLVEDCARIILRFRLFGEHINIEGRV